MCLYPKLIRNRKYVSNKKNGGNVPTPKDKRVLLVPVGCGKCMECRGQKARAWSIRLQEEIRVNKTGKFVTLTFSNESIAELKTAVEQQLGLITGYDLDNEIATLAVRRFLERWRKKHKISLKHWLITELGQGKNWKWQGTENLHLHGILFTESKTDINQIWKYGYTFIGDYVSEKSINYMTKYMTKIDVMHKQYTPKILTSPGIGKAYTERIDAKLNKYKGKNTREHYTTRQGTKINLPIYFRNKIYTEDEREQLWLQRLDKQERFVLGARIDISHGDKLYVESVKMAQTKNRRLGYGDDTKDWDQIHYENQRRELLVKKRLEKLDKLK